jgi:hypothetical protein
VIQTAVNPKSRGEKDVLAADDFVGGKALTVADASLL